MVSLWNRNPVVCDGGDAVVLVLLFWSMFADLGARFSLDVRLGRRPAAARVPAAALRFLLLQVAYIYLITFLSKRGSSWIGGTAVQLAAGSPDWGRGLGPLVASSAGLSAALTWATLAIEGLFPLLLLSPWRARRLRAIALCAGLALHIGIFLTMGVGIFSLVMPASYLVLLRPEWLDSLARRLPCLAAVPEPAPPSDRAPRARLMLALLGAQLVLVVAAQLSLALLGREPATLSWELRALGHYQNWYMFAPDVPATSVRIEAPGRLTDGGRVDVIEAAEPRLLPPRTFFFSRWHKLRYALAGSGPAVVHAMGRYLCRRYNGDTAGAKLARFEIVLHAEPIALPSGTPPPPKAGQVVLRQPCLPGS
jgi:hypothetical protein